MKRIRRVLYATDLSAASRRAFTTALAMAKSLRARLTIVYVMAPVIPTVPEQYFDAMTLDHLERQARQWSLQQLNRLADRARKAGTTARTELRRGDAADQIVAVAKSSGTDFIVVGTHGRRGLPKFFLGSVAERVVTIAPCPVVTVRGK
jgi:nucleotide-binding universal stress UspA family protein